MLSSQPTRHRPTKDDALAEALIDAYVAPLEDSRGTGAVLRETLRAYLAAERTVSIGVGDD